MVGVIRSIDRAGGAPASEQALVIDSLPAAIPAGQTSVVLRLDAATANATIDYAGDAARSIRQITAEPPTASNQRRWIAKYGAADVHLLTNVDAEPEGYVITGTNVLVTQVAVPAGNGFFWGDIAYLSTGDGSGGLTQADLDAALGAGTARSHVARHSDVPYPLWTLERAQAGFFSPGDITKRDDGALRRLSLDRGGSLGPGVPTTDPNTSGSTGTAHWLAVIIAGDLLPLIEALQETIELPVGTYTTPETPDSVEIGTAAIAAGARTGQRIEKRTPTGILFRGHLDATGDVPDWRPASGERIEYQTLPPDNEFATGSKITVTNGGIVVYWDRIEGGWEEVAAPPEAEKTAHTVSSIADLSALDLATLPAIRTVEVTGVAGSEPPTTWRVVRGHDAPALEYVS